MDIGVTMISVTKIKQKKQIAMTRSCSVSRKVLAMGQNVEARTRGMDVASAKMGTFAVVFNVFNVNLSHTLFQSTEITQSPSIDLRVFLREGVVGLQYL
jgi:hypothetical protein